jgi:hypothetical protein
MAELKTKPTKKSAKAFLESVTPEVRRKDSLILLEIFKEATGEKPMMWGESIVGFGMYHYKSERSRQEGDWPLVGFSPRKQNLSIYLISGNKDKYKDLLQKLGKHKTSVGCLYINKLVDVDLKILTRLVKECYKDNKKKLVGFQK